MLQITVREACVSFVWPWLWAFGLKCGNAVAYFTNTSLTSRPILPPSLRPPSSPHLPFTTSRLCLVSHVELLASSSITAAPWPYLTLPLCCCSCCCVSVCALLLISLTVTHRGKQRERLAGWRYSNTALWVELQLLVMMLTHMINWIIINSNTDFFVFPNQFILI